MTRPKENVIAPQGEGAVPASSARRVWDQICSKKEVCKEEIEEPPSTPRIGPNEFMQGFSTAWNRDTQNNPEWWGGGLEATKKTDRDRGRL